MSLLKAFLPPLVVLAAASSTAYIAIMYSTYSQKRDKTEMRVGVERDRESEKLAAVKRKNAAESGK